VNLPPSGRRAGGSVFDDLVAKDASFEAEKAFKSGDRRHIVVHLGDDPKQQTFRRAVRYADSYKLELQGRPGR
jgi:hypothetical protein